MNLKINQDNNSNPTQLMFRIILIWSIYASTYSLLKYLPHTALFSGYLSLIGEAGLDIFLTLLTFNLWYKTNFYNNKMLFRLFFLSFLAAIMADGIYNIVLNLFGFNYVNPIIICMFELPFLLFLLFQATAWGYILYINKENVLKFNTVCYLPYLVVSTLMFIMFMFGIKWQIHYFSLKGIFQSIDTVLEVVGFSIATICLARAQTFVVRFTSIGYLLIVASDFIIRYHVVSGEVPYLSSLESTWVLGLILMSLGFFLVKNSFDEKLFKLSAINSLQSQIGIWLLVLWLISTFLFAGTSYFFSSSKEPYLNYITQNFLSMLIPFSVLVITSSSYIATKISSPLSKLESKINEFILTEVPPESLPNLANYKYISEFKALEDFILGSFILYQKKHIADMTFAKIATQVSHDIRSPLAAINIITSNLITIPERQRIMIRNATTRINDIANNLLSQSKSRILLSTNEETREKTNPELIFIILENIISEKRFEYYQSNIQINITIFPNAHRCFASVELSSFKRVLSNLINNSVEAVNSNGMINIAMSHDGTYIKITIEDNGCGIPSELLPKVTEPGFSHNKKNGAGYGLSYAKQYFEKTEALMHIKSTEGLGTLITIFLPYASPPAWFCDAILLSCEHTIFILDDDASIKDAWNTKFKEINYSSLIYCSNSSEFIKNHLNQHSPALYLIDLELIGENKNGLDVIEELNLGNNAILVTSCFEDSSIRTRCIKNNVKILPKFYMPYINIISIN